MYADKRGESWFFMILELTERITGGNAFDVPDRRVARAPVVFQVSPQIMFTLFF